MTHIRTQIRDEIFLAVTGLDVTGLNVFKSRTVPVDTLPSLIVSTGNEEIDEEEGRVARVQSRKLEIIVRGYDKLKVGLDDQLDSIAEEVETAVLNATYSTITAIDLIAVETNIEDGSEQPVGEITLIFSVSYLTRDGAPGITF